MQVGLRRSPCPYTRFGPANIVQERATASGRGFRKAVLRKYMISKIRQIGRAHPLGDRNDFLASNNGKQQETATEFWAEQSHCNWQSESISVPSRGKFLGWRWGSRKRGRKWLTGRVVGRGQRGSWCSKNAIRHDLARGEAPMGVRNEQVPPAWSYQPFPNHARSGS